MQKKKLSASKEWIQTPNAEKLHTCGPNLAKDPKLVEQDDEEDRLLVLILITIACEKKLFGPL